MIDPLSIWKSTFANLPQVSDSSWASNFANWVYDRVQSAELSGVMTASDPFDFKKGIFESALLVLPPTPSAAVGILGFATAWETAVVASSTLLVTSGDSLGAPSPATTWSVVSSSIVDTPSIAIGKAIILTLATMPPVPTVDLSKFPEIFRNAFLALTGSIVGMNSVVPPVPLPAPMVPFM